MLGDFLDDPILSDRQDLTLSIYGAKQEFRTSRLSAMHLQIAEGHVLGQASVRRLVTPIIFAVKDSSKSRVAVVLTWLLFKKNSISFYLHCRTESVSWM